MLTDGKLVYRMVKPQGEQTRYIYRFRFQGKGGNWYGWDRMHADSEQEVRQRIVDSGLCGDAATIQIERGTTPVGYASI